MRDFKGMKRQRGRNRPGGGGGKPGGGGNANRAFDSNGPENLKVRGSAQHIFEKYQQLARDAGAGDRVLLENYLQHAEHYYRLIRTLQPQRPPAEIMGRDNFANGYDIDFEDETVEAQQAASEAAGAAAEDAGAPAEEPRGDGFREGRRDERVEYGRDRGDRPRDGQREFRGEGGQGRDGQNREGRPDRDEFRREGRGDFSGQPRQERGERDRGDRDRSDRDRGERDRGERRERFDRDRPREGRSEREGRYGERSEARFGDRPREDNAGEPAEAPTAAPVADVADEDGRMLRDEEGGLSPAPAFLQSSAPAPDGEGRSRTRRRRPPRDAESGEDDTPPTGTDEA